MQDGRFRDPCELHAAADVARGDHGGSCRHDVGHLAIAQAPCNFRLQDIVNPSRSAAEVTVPDLTNFESRLGEQAARCMPGLLGMLQ